MKNKIIAVIGIIFWGCIWVTAQNKVELRSPKQKHTRTDLYDENNNFLLTLPLTFSITDKNILIVMIGDDIRISGKQTVWLFSDEIYLANLIKSNRNVSAIKSFKKRNKKFDTVLVPHRRIALHRKFDDGFEVIKKNAKPVFLNINDPSSDPLTFYLQFYVTKPDNKYPYVFFAKCKPIEIELIIE